MIEVVIDFNEINISDKDKYTDIEYKLGRYLYNKLKIGPQDLPKEDPNGRGIVQDAFKDNFWPLGYKEWTEYKKVMKNIYTKKSQILNMA